MTMENNQINNSRVCSKYYKCIAITVAMIALAGSTTYLLLQNNKQKDIIQDHARQINEIQSAINNNREMINCNDNLNSILNDSWLSFNKTFSNIDNQISELHSNFFKNGLNAGVNRGYNIVSNEQGYTVTIAVPGFSKEEIAIKLSGHRLEINAKHVSQDNNENANNKDINTQPQETCRYRLDVPANIDQNNITAQLNNGLLTIKFHKIIGQTNNEPKEILID